MKITAINIYFGPNLYTRFPVVCVQLSLETIAEWPTNRLGDAFINPLLECLPGLKDHDATRNTKGKFVGQIQSAIGVSVSQVFEHVAMELQRCAGHEAVFSQTIIGTVPGNDLVLVSYEDYIVAMMAVRFAFSLISYLLPAEIRPSPQPTGNLNLADEIKIFVQSARNRSLDISTAALVKSARQRDIPFIRISPNSKFVQFGYGCQQKRILETFTTGTSMVGGKISHNKIVTSQLLRKLGLPAPQQVVISDVNNAAQAAERIGYPLVVKPSHGLKGIGITVGVTNKDELKQAIHRAQGYGNIVLEEYIPGMDHRMLVINGKLIATARRIPGHVTGDGISTIAQLVEQVNQDPRRGVGFDKSMVLLELDEKANTLLKKTGYERSSVPDEDEIVYLRDTANIASGGTSIDVTDQVHPDNRLMAEHAASATGLDIAGVDFITPDISKSYKNIRSGICEVNACPSFRPHWVAEGPPRDVTGPVIDMLFPHPEDARIPIITVTGSNKISAITKMAAYILQMDGRKTGMASSVGGYVDDHQIREENYAGNKGAEMILCHPLVDCALLETNHKAIAKSGLLYDRHDIVAIVDISVESVGSTHIDHKSEAILRTCQLLSDIAQHGIVINADDDLCSTLSEHAHPAPVCYVSIDENNPIVINHINNGGFAVVLAELNGNRVVTIINEHKKTPVMSIACQPDTHDDLYARDTLFAVAITTIMGISAQQVESALASFKYH